MNKEERRGLVIKVLLAIIVILVLFIIFIFVVRPSFNNYVYNKQIAAQAIVLNNILYQLQQQGYVQLPVGENQTLILVPYKPSATPLA
jgi:hypothetical protein